MVSDLYKDIKPMAVMPMEAHQAPKTACNLNADYSTCACSSLLPFQMLAFKAFTAKHLTVFEAGFAATFVIFPNIILFVAFLAGLLLSFNIAMPGMVSLPTVLTSVAAISPM